MTMIFYYVKIKMVIRMLVYNIKKGVEIENVLYMEWDKTYVTVAPRPYNALLLRYEGEADFCVNGMTFRSENNDITVMPAGCGYDVNYTASNKVLVFHFTSDEEIACGNYKVKTPKAAERVFRTALSAYLKKECGYYYDVMSCFYKILKMMQNSMDNTMRTQYESFYDALDYLHCNFNHKELTVKKLSYLAHMSDTYFRKLFFDIYGVSPSEYIKKLRIEYAEELLIKGIYSVNEVAEMTGYDDSKYFSRVIKEHFGCPPSKLYIHR